MCVVSLPGTYSCVFLTKSLRCESMAAAAAVVVDELVAGGNAERAGVLPGDVLEEVSCVMLKAGKEGEYASTGHGGRPYDNFDKSMFKCAVRRQNR